jgi:peptide deformylase
LATELVAVLEERRAEALTAPQIGVELQVMVLRRYLLGEPEADSGVRIVINPMLLPEHGDLVYDWEGCLSIPNLKGLVPRYPTVRLCGLDGRGEPVDCEVTGWAARVLQHAHDHLSGVVFLDRMGDLRSLAFAAEWREFLAEGDLEASADEESR